LEELRNAREKAIASRRRVFTGTNQYANLDENALGRIEDPYLPGCKRGAEGYEQLRLRTERYAAESGRTPRILLAEFGDAKMRTARAIFASSFFACAGFAITTQRIVNTDEIATVDTDLIVLCSSDAAYLGAATAIISKVKAAAREIPVLVAGNPESVEQLRSAGVADFIHIRSNPIEVLTNWQQRVGMKV
jgi:methylmalonyl-CoA mutase